MGEMKSRTRIQEQRYWEAIGYVEGRKDSPHVERKDQCVGENDFATFFSMYEDMVQTHITIQNAYKYFRNLKMEEQKAYGIEWMRLPYSMYEEMNKLIAERYTNG